MLPEAKDFAGKEADCLVPIYRNNIIHHYLQPFPNTM
jgi:hypothetical protein